MKLWKKNPLRMVLNSQSGQAVVEYVLILIISVTLLILAKGLFSSVNTFMTSYVGTYFKCLLVQGELPALGVKEDDLKKHTGAGYKCSISYEKSNIADNGGSSGGPKNTGTTKPLTPPTQGSTKETASRRGASASASTSSKSKSKKINRANTGEDDDDTRFSSAVRNRSDAYNTADSEEYDEGIRSVSMSRDKFDEKPEKYRAITGQQADDILKRTRGGRLKDRLNATKKIPLSDELRPGPRRNKLNPPTRAVAAVKDQVEEPFSFGYFLKWIIIAGILIALIVFFGGQVLSYSKSDSN